MYTWSTEAGTLLKRSAAPSKLREGADKSLAPPTYRCRRTESIVLLERGVC